MNIFKVKNLLLIVLLVFLTSTAFICGCTQQEKIDKSDSYSREFGSLILDYEDENLTDEEIASNLNKLRELQKKVDEDKEEISNYSKLSDDIEEEIEYTQAHFMSKYYKNMNALVSDIESGAISNDEGVKGLNELRNLAETEYPNGYWFTQEEYEEFIDKISNYISDFEAR